MKNLLVVRHYGMASIAGGITLIGGLVIQEPPSRETIYVLGIATLLLAVGGIVASAPWSVREATAVASAATLGMTILIGWRFHVFLAGVPSVFVAQGLALVTLIGVYTIGQKDRRLVRWIAIIGVLTVVWVGLSISYGDVLDTDVYDLHEQAADALLDGRNPYTTGSVSVVESHPFQGRELIREYTYPPTALIAYAGSSILFGESRVVGAIAIAASMALALYFVGRRLQCPGRGQHLDAAMAALLGSNPVNYLMVFTGWTEAVALPFMLVSAGLWHRNPTVSAISLGISVSTKQYFLLAIPILALVPDPRKWRRLALVVATAAATFVPFLLWDAKGLVNGVVTHHITRAPRLDAATLGGIGVNLPSAMAVAGGVAIGIAVIIRMKTSGTFWLALGASIGSFTFLAVRGFRNSWWLVIATVSVGIAFLSDPPKESTVETDDSEGPGSVSFGEVQLRDRSPGSAKRDNRFA